MSRLATADEIAAKLLELSRKYEPIFAEARWKQERAMALHEELRSLMPDGYAPAYGFAKHEDPRHIDFTAGARMELMKEADTLVFQWLGCAPAST